MDMQAETMAGMEHAGHDHSAHAGVAAAGMGHEMHSAVMRREDGSYYYTHGAFLGHVVPGSFFLFWGIWWLVAAYHTFLKSTAARRKFAVQASYPVFFGPSKLRAFPLEPVVKIVLPFIGILGELWLGHGPQYQPLHLPDGKFNVDSLNDWQHSAMYSAFMVSGLVDLLGTKMDLPSGTGHGFLGLAFLSEGLLLAFHLKGPDIEWTLHFILVMQIFTTVLAILFEALMPSSLLVASLRPILTVVQGIWWIQTAYFMYDSIPAWDPDYMGSAMMAPVVLVMDLVWVSLAALLVLLGMRLLYTKWYGGDLPFTATYKSAGTSSYMTVNGGGSRGYGSHLAPGNSMDEEQAVLELAAIDSPKMDGLSFK